MHDLTGKTALITAAGSGIGKACAAAMATHGAHVVVTDRDMAAAQYVAAEIARAGGAAAAFKCDISSEDDIKAAINYCVTEFGRIDILHNNAAHVDLAAMADDIDILTMSLDTWDKAMQVTLRGTMLCCRHGIQQMLPAGGGCIINTSSMYGVSPFFRNPSYSVSKAAVNFLTQHIATSFGRQGIRCNAVAPSMIRTPTLDSAVPPELIELNAENTLTPFLGTTDDIANIVVFLASDAARYLNGQIIRADGGTTVHLPTNSAARKFFQSL